MGDRNEKKFDEGSRLELLNREFGRWVFRGRGCASRSKSFGEAETSLQLFAIRWLLAIHPVKCTRKPGPHRSHYNSRTNGRWIRARPSPLINIPRHEHTHVFATPDALRANYTARYCHRVSFHLLRGHDLRFDTIDIPTNYPRRIGKTITNFCAIWIETQFASYDMG